MDAEANKSDRRYVDLSNCEGTSVWVPMRLNTVNKISLKPGGEFIKTFSKTEDNFFKKRITNQIDYKTKLNYSGYKTTRNRNIKNNITANLKNCLKKTNMQPNLFNSMYYLEIKGQNLLDFEKNREISSKCKTKKYYKTNVLDAVQYLKKMNVNSDLLNEKDIQKHAYNLFKDETYAISYSNTNSYNKKLTTKTGDYNYHI